MLSPVERIKIRLMAEGMTITPAAQSALTGAAGGRPITLADYASTSGITLELEQDIWVNAPFKEHNPNFVHTPPHQLDFGPDGFVVVSGGISARARPVPVPEFSLQKNPAGVSYLNYGLTHTDRVRISPIEGCAYACRFCDSSCTYEYRKKDISGLIQTVEQAINDPVLPAKHILISGGTPRPADYDYLRGVYASVAEAFPAINVDVMMAPVPEVVDPAFLLAAGINELSINLELFNPKFRAELMPDKDRNSRDECLAFIGRCVKVMGGARVRSILIVGLEPPEDTLQGVEALARIGCEPVLSPFRPDPRTPLHDCPPPSASLLECVYEQAQDIAGKYGVKLGPKCIPCMHNTLTFPDGSGYYKKNGESA